MLLNSEYSIAPNQQLVETINILLGNNTSRISCSNLGVSYEYGKGIRKSGIKALEYYGKACDLKSVIGCKNYARLKK
jgi:TPR repeat protein